MRPRSASCTRSTPFEMIRNRRSLSARRSSRRAFSAETRATCSAISDTVGDWIGEPSLGDVTMRTSGGRDARARRSLHTRLDGAHSRQRVKRDPQIERQPIAKLGYLPGALAGLSGRRCVIASPSQRAPEQIVQSIAPGAPACLLGDRQCLPRGRLGI